MRRAAVVAVIALVAIVLPLGSQAAFAILNESDGYTTDTPLPVSAFLPQITGKYDNPNLLQGSQSTTTENQGRSKKGKTKYSLTWYLERQGTTK